ncbi:MAG: lasso RiPP family leader peptide-containing protein [Acidimicrobiia bacterium]|nr:lasso RiPP family leader peptide-containing protein [Acidimicrobiia bacterium]
MGSGQYIKPELTDHGSVVSLTLGKPGSDVDGASGMLGNASMSDTTGGGSNAGGGPANNNP